MSLDFTSKAFSHIWNSSIKMFSLTILIICSVALFHHNLDSMSFAAIISTLVASYHLHDGKIQAAALMNPPRPGV